MSKKDTVDKPNEEYFEYLSQGQFMIQYSPSTDQYVFYPRVAAPRTGATDLQWVPASGNGVVYATTTMRPRPPQPAYNVSLIELAEGPRMMSRVDGIDAEQVRIGMPVTARVVSGDDGPLVVFEVAQS